MKLGDLLLVHFRESGRRAAERERLSMGVVFCNSQTNQASSSALLVGAGSGAPVPSVVGNRTWPSFPNGFNDLMDDRSPVVCLEVFTGTSARRDQPREFMESLNDEEAILNLSYLNPPVLPDSPNTDQYDESGLLPRWDPILVWTVLSPNGTYVCRAGRSNRRIDARMQGRPKYNGVSNDLCG
jgi:hypothetical protein